MPEAEVTGGVVEIPLAQTGEGIADCELIRWFVKEVNVVSREDFVYDARSEPP
jgi:2-oxoisovalerate dehydrogenase E2 component (dihydrolipoyl transacylase)